MKEKCGTPGYFAPEQKAGSFVGTKMDMWAFGVMLYEMAVAYKPTELQSYRYGSGPIPFRQSNWAKVSKDAQDLICLCLQIEPEKRISAEEALQHAWFETDQD